MLYTNRYNLPQALVDVISSDYDPTKAEPTRIGVTTLINPPRQRMLKIANWDMIQEDVSDQLWLLMGNAVHYILSEVVKKKEKSKNRFVEEKIEKEVDGITIVGKLDLYDGLIRSVEDYKITSVWSVIYTDKVDWENQLNVYAWLLRKCGFEVESLYINAILKDWKKSGRLQNSDYPPIPFKRIKVNLWTFEKQEAYVLERVKHYKECIGKSEEELPICSPEERWAKPNTYAVYKGDNKRALRVLDTPQEADFFIEANFKKNEPYRLEERKGGDMKCQEYCQVCQFCSYWKENYGEKQSKIDYAKSKTEETFL